MWIIVLISFKENINTCVFNTYRYMNNKSSVFLITIYPSRYLKDQGVLKIDVSIRYI